MKKKTWICFAAAFLSAAMSIPSFAAGWQQDGQSWRYQKNDGNQARGEWVEDNQKWYRMDDNGLMQVGWYQDNADGGRWYYLNPQSGDMTTGWQQIDGKWYFQDTRDNGPLGSMLIGWQQIDGRWYYLDPADGGALATNKLVDGQYQVNENGAWVDASGNPYEEAGQGIPSVRQSGAIGSGTVTAGSGASSGGGSSSSGNSSDTNPDSDEAEETYMVGVQKDVEESSSENSEIDDAIDAFKEQYITDGMSDFEKEMQIIQWLVENCTYDYDNYKAKTIPNESYTAYGAICLGTAVCDGYARAFLKMGAGLRIDGCESGKSRRSCLESNQAGWQLV